MLEQPQMSPVAGPSSALVDYLEEEPQVWQPVDGGYMRVRSSQVRCVRPNVSKTSNTRNP